MAIPVVGDQQNSYDGIIHELFCGLHERARMLNNCGKWPKTNKIWEQGIAGTVTENMDGTITMVDATPQYPPPTALGDPPQAGPKDWTMPPGTGSCPTSGASKWVGFHDECSCYIPNAYDIVFEVGGEWDETKIVRGQITSHTAPTPAPGVHPSVTFTGKSIRNAVIGGFIPSVATLSGKKYYFIKRQGMFWSDVVPEGSKWIPFPNDRELWRDKSTAGSDKFLRAAYDSITGPQIPQAWPPDKWIGKEVLAYDDSGNLHRLTIIWGDNNTVYFVPKPDPSDPPEDQMPPGWIDPSPLYTLVGIFTIVEPGSKGDPNRWSPQVGAWHTGAKEVAFTHYPGNKDTDAQYGGAFNDLLVLQDIAATNVQWAEGSPCQPLDPEPCTSKNHPGGEDIGRAHEFDLWSADDEECGAPLASDKNYSPRAFWSLRMLQAECVRLCYLFLDHTQSNPEVLSNFTPATYFHAMGVNSGTSTVVEDSPNVFSAAVNPIYNGYRVWYSVKNANGGVRLSGQSIAAAGKIGLSSDLYNATEAAVDPSTRENDVGKQVIYTVGFTRGDNNGHGPLEVRYLFPKGPIFIADTNDEFIPPEAIDPAAVSDFDTTGCTGVGSFVKRDASITFLDHTEEGLTVDGSVAIPDNLPFRYVGDNWHDPTVRIGSTNSSLAVIQESTGQEKYWDRFYQGTHALKPQAFLESLRSGSVADNGAPTPVVISDGRSFKISGPANLRHSWHAGGLMRTESGTASGGSTSTLVDNNKLTTDESGCFIFEAGRWPNDKPHVGLVMKITSGPNAGLKRPISDSVANFGTHTVTYTFLYNFPNAITAGTTYEIEEPHEANQFQRRCLRVYDPPPLTTFHDLIVSHSDSDTFWYDETFTPLPKSKWQIIEPNTGGIWKRTNVAPTPGTLYVKADATRWYVPVNSGMDPRGQPWHTNSNENLAYLGGKKYGYIMKGDYRTVQVLRELWTAINYLRWIQGDVTWTNQIPYTPFPNANLRAASFVENVCTDTDSTHPNAQDDYASYWACVDDWITAYWNDPQHLGAASACESACSTATVVGDLPTAYSFAWIDQDPDTLVFSSFDTGLARSFLYALVENVPTCLTVDVEIWVKAGKAFEGMGTDNVFDTMGDGSFSENNWGEILSGTVGMDGSTAVVKVGYDGPTGDYGPENKPPLFQPVLNAGYRIRGYVVKEAKAILKPHYTCCVAPPEEGWEFFD